MGARGCHATPAKAFHHTRALQPLSGLSSKGVLRTSEYLKLTFSRVCAPRRASFQHRSIIVAASLLLGGGIRQVSPFSKERVTSPIIRDRSAINIESRSPSGSSAAR